MYLSSVPKTKLVVLGIDDKMAKSLEPIEKIYVVNLDSDDIAENRLAHLKKHNEEVEFPGALTALYTAAVETVSWLGALLYTAGSVSDLFFDFWYVIDHSILAAGSILWMLYALAEKKYAILLQHAVTFLISMYVLIKQLNIGKFAYLSTALLCTTCSVYRHESVMSDNLACATVGVTNPRNVIGIPSMQRRPVCDLETVYLTLDEKIKIVKKIENILVYLNGNDFKTGPLRNIQYRHIYVTAKTEMTDILNSLRMKKSYCESYNLTIVN